MRSRPPFWTPCALQSGSGSPLWAGSWALSGITNSKPLEQFSERWSREGGNGQAEVSMVPSPRKAGMLVLNLIVGSRREVGTAATQPKRRFLSHWLFFSLYQHGGLVQPHLTLEPTVQSNTSMNTAITSSLPALSNIPCPFLFMLEDYKDTAALIPLLKWRKEQLSLRACR